jgi:hypothetical protein
MKNRREDLEERMRVAMRTAIRKHPKAKLWAKVNYQDNFSLAVLSTARDAALDIISNDIDSNSSDVKNHAIDWMNEQVGRKLDAFVLTTCREMYSVLRI